jgi:hypothetical protein
MLHILDFGSERYYGWLNMSEVYGIDWKHDSWGDITNVMEVIAKKTIQRFYVTINTYFAIFLRLMDEKNPSDCWKREDTTYVAFTILCCIVCQNESGQEFATPIHVEDFFCAIVLSQTVHTIPYKVVRNLTIKRDPLQSIEINCDQ